MSQNEQNEWNEPNEQKEPNEKNEPNEPNKITEPNEPSEQKERNEFSSQVSFSQCHVGGSWTSPAESEPNLEVQEPKPNRIEPNHEKNYRSRNRTESPKCDRTESVPNVWLSLGGWTKWQERGLKLPIAMIEKWPFWQLIEVKFKLCNYKCFKCLIHSVHSCCLFTWFILFIWFILFSLLLVLLRFIQFSSFLSFM